MGPLLPEMKIFEGLSPYMGACSDLLDLANPAVIRWICTAIMKLHHLYYRLALHCMPIMAYK